MMEFDEVCALLAKVTHFAERLRMLRQYDDRDFLYERDLIRQDYAGSWGRLLTAAKGHSYVLDAEIWSLEEILFKAETDLDHRGRD